MAVMLRPGLRVVLRAAMLSSEPVGRLAKADRRSHPAVAVRPALSSKPPAAKNNKARTEGVGLVSTARATVHHQVTSGHQGRLFDSQVAKHRRRYVRESALRRE